MSKVIRLNIKLKAALLVTIYTVPTPLEICRYISCLVRNGHSSIIAGSLSRGDGSCNRGRDRFEEQWMSVGGLVGRRMGARVKKE